ncbi:Cytochrome P450 [Parasponia andersonii]|uniref:Cytochrome P450 n=1 Tax=Parasponia andersonii TaxID=3476 RepID=A0A2P5A768_PARAD|nr:Cytochrome P450 [Parasponia andersonii]
MELETFLLMKIMLTLVSLGLISILLGVFHTLILNPRRLRSKLRKQGIGGPPTSFLLGNILDMKRAKSQVSNPSHGEEGIIVHNCSSLLFPSLEQWSKQYGSTFMFSLGNLQYLHINNPDVVKEISIYTSFDFGKPSHQRKLLGPLLGQGILTSNGTTWSHQRKILAPEFTIDSVKGVMNLMAESAVTLVKSWTRQIESEGGVADIEIDEYLNRFSVDVISRACFGNNYSKGEEIFLKLRDLQQNMTKKAVYLGLPIFRYLPTKVNRETKKLENEIQALILNVVDERNRSTCENYNDLLQIILEGAKNSSDLSQEDANRFIIDNCKNIYLAGFETTAVSATWILMLLASNPEWQARARAEVLEICGENPQVLPDANMVQKMKTLRMVILESLRLYPPVPMISREAQQDLKLGDIHVPKGVQIWTMLVTLQQDPEIWGLDAHRFNPQRFANGVSSSCKLPHVYMPFGAGPRVCLGQNFAMAELKILLAVLLSNFSFSLSPKYRHSPVQKLVVKPEYGVNLHIRKL